MMLNERGEQTVPAETPPAFPAGVSKLGAREQVAVRFAWALFSVCALFSLALLVYWYSHIPAPPDLAKSSNPGILLDQYRTQQELVFEQVSKIFDLIVGKAFLPIFATIIGYLLGKRSASD